MKTQEDLNLSSNSKDQDKLNLIDQSNKIEGNMLNNSLSKPQIENPLYESVNFKNKKFKNEENESIKNNKSNSNEAVEEIEKLNYSNLGLDDILKELETKEDNTFSNNSILIKRRKNDPDLIVKERQSSISIISEIENKEIHIKTEVSVEAKNNNNIKESSAEDNKPPLSKLQQVKNFFLDLYNDEEKRKKLSYCGIILLLIIFFFILFGLLAYSNDEILAHTKDIYRSKSDKREYRMIKLKNNLEVLLIKDKTQTKCALSMTIDVGTLNDSTEFPGSVHLLEHMISVEDKNKPKKERLDNILMKYNGQFSSFTEEEKTNFYLEVDQKGFHDAIHAFAKLFIKANFDIDSIDNEISNIDKEFDQTSAKDSWREQQLLKTLANPDSSYSKFNYGRTDLFDKYDDDELLEELNRIFKKYYISKNIRLVVYSPNSLKDTQKIIVDNFSNIRQAKSEIQMVKPNPMIKTMRKTPKREKTEMIPVFTNEQLGSFIWYSKISQQNSLEFYFYFPELITQIQNKSVNYITYMLKYSGSGSLNTFLKINNMALKFEVGVIASFKTFSLFSISLDLTDNGVINTQKIIEIVFNYLNLLRESKIDEKIYKDIQNFHAINFKFQDIKQQDINNEIINISFDMFNYNFKNILFSNDYHKEFNNKEIADLVDILKPDNSLIIMGSSIYPSHLNELLGFNSTEPIYNTIYSSKKLPTYLMDVLSERDWLLKDDYITQYPFKLRSVNKFITKETGVQSTSGKKLKEDKNMKSTNKDYNNTDDKIPTMLVNSTNLKMWMKNDKSFYIPKADIRINIFTESLRDSFMENAIFNTFNFYLKYILEVELSDAIDAGNTLEFKTDENGLNLRIYAYSDLIIEIFSKISKSIFEKEISEKEFNFLKQLMLEDIKQTENSGPGVKSQLIFKKLVKPGFIPLYQELRTTLNDNFDYNFFIEKLTTLRENLQFNILIYGFIQSHVIHKVQYILSSYVSMKSDKISLEKQAKQFELTKKMHSNFKLNGKYLYHTKTDDATQTENYLEIYNQIEAANYKSLVLSKLSELMISEDFTKRVSILENISSSDYKLEVIDNIIYFVGTLTTKDDLRTAEISLNSIFDDVRKNIENLDNDKFENLKEVVYNYYLNNSNSLKSKADLAWNQIYEAEFDFNLAENILEYIKVATKSDLNFFLLKLIQI